MFRLGRSGVRGRGVEASVLMRWNLAARGVLEERRGRKRRDLAASICWCMVRVGFVMIEVEEGSKRRNRIRAPEVDRDAEFGRGRKAKAL